MQVNNSTQNLAIIGGSTVIGAGAGLLAGNAKVKKTMAPFLQQEDKYVSERVQAGIEKLGTARSSKSLNKIVRKITQKAKSDFEAANNQIKSTKIKYVAVAAAIGLAVGGAIAAIKNHHNNSKENINTQG